jgi:ATP-dependent DNA helicase RecG
VSALVEFSEALSVTVLKGVGPRQAERLARLAIHTLADLLFHLPLRYQDRTRVTPIGGLQLGEEAVIQAEVVMAEIAQRGRRALLCRVQDGTGSLTLRFFHFSAAQYHFLSRPGTRLRCFGEVRAGPATLEMVHPECRRGDEDAPGAGEDRLTPVYPSTEGLPQYTLRALTEQVLLRLAENPETLPELIPAELRSRLGMPTLVDALRLLHRPPPETSAVRLAADRQPARQRLAFEELLAHQLSLCKLRQQIQRHRAPVLDGADTLVERFLKHLPFVLTAAQQRVIGEIRRDLARSRPMLRLVQGDVGSGKTVVAAVAVLRAVQAGRQAAVMAPTELLAEQHYRTFRQWLEPLGLTVAWLSGRLKGKARETLLEQIRDGAAAVVVGTHALFQEGVGFAQLALIVIDEQHRFGVHQRLALREKGRRAGQRPHQLIMTATPIPRTLAMSVYADLDTSVIDELPPGRRPVQTVVVPEQRRVEVIERVRLACRQGRQAYWVCTLIDESEALDYQAAADTAAQLTAALPELRIGLVHGRQKSVEKEVVMAAFKAAELDLLVATTVIEVGVDVPNASLMVIENAERLGLAQLHQLRGRIGRSDIASSCVLLYRRPLSAQARSRLAVLRESSDGFEIARHDLDLRGPGEVLGTRQTGALQLRVADWVQDEALLPQVRHSAAQLLRDHPERSEAIIRRWIGQGERYGEV